MSELTGQYIFLNKYHQIYSLDDLSLLVYKAVKIQYSSFSFFFSIFSLYTFETNDENHRFLVLSFIFSKAKEFFLSPAVRENFISAAVDANLFFRRNYCRYRYLKVGE